MGYRSISTRHLGRAPKKKLQVLRNQLSVEIRKFTSKNYHVGVLHQPDAGADRALRQQQGRQVQEGSLCAAEDARREGRAAPPRQDRRQADQAAQGAGRLYRRAARKARSSRTTTVIDQSFGGTTITT